MKLGDRVSLSFLAYLDAAFIGVFLFIECFSRDIFGPREAKTGTIWVQK